MKKHLFFLVALMFAVLAGATASQFPDTSLVVQGFNITPALVSGVSLLCSFVELAPAGALGSYAMISIPKKSSNAGKPSPKKDHIIVFRWSDVSNPPARDAKGILIVDDLVLNTSNAISMYVTTSELAVKQNQEGDIDAKGWLQEIAASHPGDSLEIDEFLENNLNENLGLLILPFDPVADKKLCGAPEAPLQIEAESTDSKDGNKNVITFKSTMRGPRIAHYQGAIPTLDSGGSQSA